MKIEGEIKMRDTEIKYDLTNSVKKVTLKDRLSKVFKVDKKNIWGRALPILFGVALLNGLSLPLLVLMPFGLLGYGIARNVENKLNSSFKKSGAEELKSIAADVQGEDTLGLNTNAKLLSLAKEEKRIYNFTTNDNKLPVLLQSKLIHVPVYTRTGEVETIPVVQEHAIGSKVYKLTRVK